jgi:Tol biopolymer transport system component
VLPVGGSLGDLNHVIGHELVHAFQYDITGRGNPNSLGAVPGAAQLPLWFIEGMAEYFSLGSESPLTAMWMRGAMEDTMPSWRQLDDPRFFPYRYGQALLAYIGGTWGDRTIVQLLRASGRNRDMDAAIRSVLRLPPDSLVAQWHRATYATYATLRSTTQAAGTYGPRLVPVRKNENLYNIAPSLSPDGSRLMFLSDRNLFSIDLFLADARTGKVERRVTQTALDPHLQSLEFIQSAGSWAPDGKRFVFAGIASGRPVLELYNADRGQVEREIPLRSLGDALNPSWSPDGRRIVFSGVSGGLTDLYVYDLEARSLKRLTQDAFADLQPVWSPDGSRIAFATDRFTTDTANLRIGPYALALLDPATGRVSRVAGFPGAQQLNPQWTPDGHGLYFVANPGGISDTYRVELSDGSISRITNLFTGVSGITETSPALTVAARSGRMVYSVFHEQGHELYAIDSPAPEAVAQAGAAVATADLLPPLTRAEPLLSNLLHDPKTGLPADSGEIGPYHPKLSLTYVGQPSLFAGSNQFGTYVGGGAALYFSDLLGNHNLITGLQVNGGLKDVTAQVGYQDLGHRLNWGAVAQQVPYVTGSFAQGPALLNGEPVFVQQQLLERQTNRDIQGNITYPFNTAQRIELAAGYSNISFDRELQTQAVSLATGEQVVDHTEDLPAGKSLNLGVGMAALVYDNSILGATAPILGQRYRLEVSPTVGSISYLGVLADYRRYVYFPARPFTLAGRILQYGRYGSGGEDPRLQPLFLGFDGLVRGYTFGSFDASECHPPADNPNGCPAFDQLLGSRMAVANVELRFPLLGVLGLGSGYYGALPIDFMVFGDGGLAWDSQNKPSFAGGDRKPVFSTGAGLRFNLFGFAVLEADLVHPFDRPDKGVVWEFQLQPGF